MSNVYYFEDEITVESVQTLIDKLETFEGEVDLFFSTNGGRTTCMDCLIHYLNKRKDEIHIICTDELVSAGTMLLVDFKGKITLHSSLDFILFHKGDKPSYTLLKNGSVDVNKILKQVEQDNKIYGDKFEKLGLNKKQMKDYYKGKDVVLYQDDFKQLKLNESSR